MTWWHYEKKTFIVIIIVIDEHLTLWNNNNLAGKKWTFETKQKKREKNEGTFNQKKSSASIFSSSFTLFNHAFFTFFLLLFRFDYGWNFFLIQTQFSSSSSSFQYHWILCPSCHGHFLRIVFCCFFPLYLQNSFSLHVQWFFFLSDCFSILIRNSSLIFRFRWYTHTKNSLFCV